jgi:hypothetical protein
MISVEHYWIETYLPHRLIERSQGTGHANLISGLAQVFSHTRKRATLLFSMSLILTIFALVFITELVSWVGKSVLLQFVHILAAHRWLW